MEVASDSAGERTRQRWPACIVGGVWCWGLHRNYGNLRAMSLLAAGWDKLPTKGCSTHTRAATTCRRRSHTPHATRQPSHGVQQQQLVTGLDEHTQLLPYLPVFYCWDYYKSSTILLVNTYCRNLTKQALTLDAAVMCETCVAPAAVRAANGGGGGSGMRGRHAAQNVGGARSEL